MEKKKYIKPSLISEEFVPQEYCKKCTNKAVYYCFCNESGYIFHDHNGNGYLDKNDKFAHKNTACQQKFTSYDKPKFNALRFSGWQLNSILPPKVKEGQKGNGTPGFLYDDHFSTKFDVNPHYVS